MSSIKPFKAVRPKENLVSRIASLPYDVFDENEARSYIRKHPLSFLTIDRPETFFPEGTDPYVKEVYDRAASEYKNWKEKGYFIQDETPCFYLYEQTLDGRSQTGIVALASVDEYLNNQIKKHENTRQEKELDRIKHVDTLDAQTGPIFLAYKAQTQLQALIYELKKRPTLYSFEKEDGVKHQVWKIDSEQDIANIVAAFENIDSLYIADGHHRAASAVKVCQKRRETYPDYPENAEFNGFLSVIFPDEELKIMDYNRVVKDLCGRTSAEFLEALWQDFVVAGPFNEPVKLENKGEIGMFLQGRWYHLVMKPSICSEDPVEGLDVSILQKYVLEKHLNILDPKTDQRIDFVGGIRGVEELERRCSEDAMVAFAMYPTSMEELFRVADQGLLMPPKSTWFEPKLLSGIFIHELS